MDAAPDRLDGEEAPCVPRALTTEACTIPTIDHGFG